MNLNPTERQALQYVKNTNGGAFVSNFIEDHEPVGDLLWLRLSAAELVNVSGATGRIYVTAKGLEALDA